MRLLSFSNLVLIALVLLNLCVKLLWLERNELAHDEPFTIVQAHKSWGELYSMLKGENNPPLYFIVMKLWIQLVPLDTGWLRVPSTIFNALIVWPLFLLGRSLGGIRIAVIASLLFTFNNYMYGFAHEARAYSLFALLAVSSTWQLWRIAQESERGLLWYALLSIAMVYTHFFGWLMIGTHGLFVLLQLEFRPARKGFMKAFGVLCLAYLPYAAIFLSRLTTSVVKGTWLSPPIPEELYNMIWRWSNEPVIAILLLAIIGVTLFRIQLKDTLVNIGLLWTFVPLLGMFFASLIAPIFLDRYLIFAAPGFFLLVAGSLLQVIPTGQWTNLPATVMVLSTAISFTPWKSNELHPSNVIAQVNAWKKDEMVLIQPAYYEDTYAWHIEKSLVRDPSQLRKTLNMSGIYPVNNVRDLPSELDNTPSVILVDAWSSLSDPEGSLKHSLRDTYQMIDSVQADRKVWVYRFHN